MDEPTPPRLGAPPVLAGPVSPAPSEADVWDGRRWALTSGDRDWSGSRWDGCALEGSVGRLIIADSRVTGSVLGPIQADAVDGRGSAWRATVWENVTSPAVDLSGADVQALALRGSRLGYVNLRAAECRDVLITDCLIDTLDCAEAGLTRLCLRDCRVGEVILQHSRCSEVDLRDAEISILTGGIDLRGCVLTPQQWDGLSPSLASELGVRVMER